ncbi:MAG: hypothetical protein RRB13_08580 [bacterium]|nr:hypothetical protein [bacterium]
MNESDTIDGYQFYQNSLAAANWGEEFVWSGDEQLPEELLQFSIEVASQSFYAEQLGMLGAIRLTERCQDVGMRMHLASAIMDEARHTKVFFDYLKSKKSTPQPPATHWNEINGEMGSGKSHLYGFYAHTMLENQALVSFELLQNIFFPFDLGSVYKKVKNDEARHVKMGIEFIQKLSLETPKPRETLVQIHGEVMENCGISDEACRYYAKYSELSDAQIKEKFVHRQSSMLKAVTGLP